MKAKLQTIIGIVIVMISTARCSMEHHVAKAKKKGFRINQTQIIDTTIVDGDTTISIFNCPEVEILEKSRRQLRHERKMFRDSAALIIQLKDAQIDSLRQITRQTKYIERTKRTESDNDSKVAREESKQEGRTERARERTEQSANGELSWFDKIRKIKNWIVLLVVIAALIFIWWRMGWFGKGLEE